MKITDRKRERRPRTADMVDHSTVCMPASAVPELAFLRGAVVAGSPAGSL
jgi:hypothetical protein